MFARISKKKRFLHGDVLVLAAIFDAEGWKSPENASKRRQTAKITDANKAA